LWFINQLTTNGNCFWSAQSRTTRSGSVRKRAEEAMRESEERFHTMADTLPEAIWIRALSPEKMLYVSPSFERIWGIPLEDLYRNPRLWAQAIHPEDRDRIVGLAPNFETSG
jgi:PAS domain-containing protein